MNGRTREGFYVLWTIAILICLTVCVVLLAYVSFTSGGRSAARPLPGAQATAVPDQTSDGTGSAQDQTVPAEDQQAAGQDGTVPTEDQAAAEQGQQAAAPPSTILAATMDLGQEYQDKLVFLGDSTTYGLSAYNVLPSYQVWVPASGTLSLFNWAIETVQYYPQGDTVNAQSLSIADAAAAGQPEYLIVTLGLNGVSILDESQFRDYYTGLLQAIQAASPNTRLICQSIFPVIDPGYTGGNTEGLTNQQITAANGWILDIANQMGLRYLNTAEVLTDADGNLNISYCSGDGIHFTPDGYNAILQYIRSHAYQ